jgi:hypothetical protein
MIFIIIAASIYFDLVPLLLTVSSIAVKKIIHDLRREASQSISMISVAHTIICKIIL